MYYVSGMLAVIGAVSYHYFVRRIPESLNPVVAIIGIYIAVLLMVVTLLPFFPPEGGLAKHIRQLSWIQIGVAASVFLLDLGFLLMYRHGWSISTGNLITGVVVNTVLLGSGVILLGEKASPTNLIGVAICIVGVGMIGYRP
jgi:drug/metabolite transporter (DMT)-like permease